MYFEPSIVSVSKECNIMRPSYNINIPWPSNVDIQLYFDISIKLCILFKEDCNIISIKHRMFRYDKHG
jgi:hypothetical protein